MRFNLFVRIEEAFFLALLTSYVFMASPFWDKDEYVVKDFINFLLAPIIFGVSFLYFLLSIRRCNFYEFG